MAISPTGFTRKARPRRTRNTAQPNYVVSTPQERQPPKRNSNDHEITQNANQSQFPPSENRQPRPHGGLVICCPSQPRYDVPHEATLVRAARLERARSGSSRGF